MEEILNIDLSNVGLFETLLEINFEGLYVDLHNDYDLKSINLLNNRLLLNFTKSDNKSMIQLIFENIEFIDFEIPLIGKLTIDTFYRDRREGYSSKC